MQNSFKEIEDEGYSRRIGLYRSGDFKLKLKMLQMNIMKIVKMKIVKMTEYSIEY